MMTSNLQGFAAIVRSMLGVLLCMITLACSEDGTNTADNGGMSGTGVSQGSIDSFGSIFVNGVEWETGGAEVEIDGLVAADTDLRVGMVVIVRGDLDEGGTSGVASRVDYDDDVEGPIDSNPVLVGTEKQFSVLGQMIIVDEFETRFDEGASFAGLARDDVVEVCGFFDDMGVIRASRIELIGQFSVGDEFDIEGVVAGLMKNEDGTGFVTSRSRSRNHGIHSRSDRGGEKEDIRRMRRSRISP